MFDKSTYKLLRVFYRKGRLETKEIEATCENKRWRGIDERIRALTVAKFITNWSEPAVINGQKDYKNVGYQITLEGRAYIEKRKRETVNFWVPYSITTLIAIASLICSALSIVIAARAGQP